MALAPVDLVLPRKSGPLHRVQFVIEFVGPRSVAAGGAAHLMEPNWNGALGNPEIFSMRASDLSWQRLVPSADGSYDSIALAWDLITTKGNLTSASAKNLLRMAEEFGPYISRRAMPMPPPADIDAQVKSLLRTRESLDIGVTLTVAAASSFRERDLWVECSRLGLEFVHGGFDYRCPSSDEPLVTVTPYGNVETFSLAAVQRGDVHAGLTIGFHVPLSVAPTQGLEATFRTADHLAQNLGGEVLDDSDQRLTESSRQSLRSELRKALTMFAQAGMTSGSPEVIRLYRPR